MTPALHRAPARLDHITEACLGEAAARLEGRGLTVARQLSGDFPDYPMDVPRMKEAVGCLLEESIRRAAASARLRVTLKAGRHAMMLSVKSPGEGIEPNRSQEAIPALAAEIAAAHGGRVWANGRPGRGVTFYLTLPVPPAA